MYCILGNSALKWLRGAKVSELYRWASLTRRRPEMLSSASCYCYKYVLLLYVESFVSCCGCAAITTWGSVWMLATEILDVGTWSMHRVVIVILCDNGLWPVGMAVNWDQMRSTGTNSDQLGPAVELHVRKNNQLSK